MKETIRCCISCILPCGALDVIRIVHTDGHVDEISGRSTVLAGEIMKLHPKHVLKKPSSPSHDGVVPGIVILPPDAELRRGKIYLLVPVLLCPVPGKARSKSSTAAQRNRRDGNGNRHHNRLSSLTDGDVSMTTNLLVPDQYLSEILLEKASTMQRDGRRGRVAVWRPHLESISETL
ncbi:hypothetical protein MLD38_010294 [Melastoma candidum]|uniref:Uncharacterized protein n=1 Tax=Melastoma candidum TaxID=119954 RepID=A0ACB9R2G8_9MYRT|nr:hypothetical protein MLD38_010294 [Melastoma candidum]